MQITLDLPDDVFAKVDALAREESRSLSSVLTDVIRSMKPSARQAPASLPIVPGQRFPTIKGSRAFTLEEIDRMLTEDGLP